MKEQRTRDVNDSGLGDDIAHTRAELMQERIERVTLSWVDSDGKHGAVHGRVNSAWRQQRAREIEA